MRKINNPYFLLLVLGFSLVSVHAKSQSIQDYQHQAAQNNPQLKAAYYEYQAALQKAPQVKALPDPEITFAYFISPVETRLGPQVARVSATQMFPWFGALSDRENQSLLNAKAKFEQFQEQRNRLFYNLEVLWAELFEIQEKIRLANENLEVLNTLVNISLRKYETGLVPQIDVLRAQIEQEDAKTNIRLLEDNKELMVKRFNELLNAEGTNPIVIPEALPSSKNLIFDEQEWLNKVNVQNPGLNQLRFNKDAAETAIQIAESNGLPSFGLGLDYISTGERMDVAILSDNGKDALIARLSVKIPLFRSKYKAQVEEASILRTAAQHRIDANENQLETNFYTALRDLKDAERRYVLYDEQQIQRLQQAVNILLQSYASDNSQFEEILRLDRKLFSYELERVKARADTFKALSYLKYLSGEQNITPKDINY